MEKPIMTDYVKRMFTLFERYIQEQQHKSAKLGCPFLFSQQAMIALFTIF